MGHLSATQISPSITMAPVENDSIPRSVIVPKTVEKALTLPIVSDTCSEVARCVEPLAPYMKTTYEKLSPVMEHGYKTVLAKYEENMAPLLPVNVTETVATNFTAVREYGKAVVGKVDILASDGIDQLSEKLPQLKESTPKLIADAKVSGSDLVYRATVYLTSYPAALVALKMLDTGLALVGVADTGLLNTSVKHIHSTANNVRMEAVKKAGTEKAKTIEETSILGGLLEVCGVHRLLSLLGHGASEVVYEDEHARVEVAAGEEEAEPVVVDTAELEEENISKPVGETEEKEESLIEI